MFLKYIDHQCESREDWTLSRPLLNLAQHYRKPKAVTLMVFESPIIQLYHSVFVAVEFKMILYVGAGIQLIHCLFVSYPDIYLW